MKNLLVAVFLLIFPALWSAPAPVPAHVLQDSITHATPSVKSKERKIKLAHFPKRIRKSPPKEPDFDATFPAVLFTIGLFVAGVSMLSPWLAVGIGLGILILALTLFLLFDPDSIMPKGKGIIGKFIALIVGIILLFLLLMLFIFALILGLALLIGGIVGVATEPVWGGIAICAIAALIFLISIPVYLIRKIRYKRYKRAEQMKAG